ncbi:uncharacterized protein LOC126608961 [Malus sylvestris]|uniref:uncharacterized protein LOC126608961 n=1 Tax=Malus sylvestris TaxID=3752 RepID=UPI0021ACCAB6|nr:uncharacterized protein LOC126608961 [Malus sylvestris]XP_050132934.1 uncharacterized protein LOC126608961 [Malus sylvestris]XP_050132935.1 uncharacterized protein LOC126608961 [Malus sylvestris]
MESKSSDSLGVGRQGVACIETSLSSFSFLMKFYPFPISQFVKALFKLSVPGKWRELFKCTKICRFAFKLRGLRTIFVHRKKVGQRGHGYGNMIGCYNLYCFGAF